MTKSFTIYLLLKQEISKQTILKEECRLYLNTSNLVLNGITYESYGIRNQQEYNSNLRLRKDKVLFSFQKGPGCIFLLKRG